MRLTDPWFDARFIAEVTPDGSTAPVASIEGAQGVSFKCPCGVGHRLRVGFANPRGTTQNPRVTLRDGNTHQPLFWQMSGTSLEDLTLTPSIDVWKYKYVDPSNPVAGWVRDGSCWHGFVTNGEVA